jgi:hypothetical protein
MICANCLHDRKKHCQAGTLHTPYKEEMKQAGPSMITHPYPCKSDHCNVALCSCVQFAREA